MISHQRGRETKSFRLGPVVKELLTPRLIEAGSLADFVRLIAKYPNPPHPVYANRWN